MRVSEDGLTSVLTQSPPAADCSQANPVAALVVEAMAVGHAPISDEIRHAGRLLLAALGAADEGGTRLSIPIAMQTLAREERAGEEVVRGYLAAVGERDVVLRLLVDWLVARSPVWGRQRPPGEAEAVARLIYVLLRMFESQEEADALDRALGV